MVQPARLVGDPSVIGATEPSGSRISTWIPQSGYNPELDVA
jgi:hypothetical protein